MFKIRTAKPEDAILIKTIHIKAYQKSYRGYLPDEFLDNLKIDDDVIERTKKYIEKTEGYIVSKGEDAIAFCYVNNLSENEFEIQAIYADPNHHKNGAGRQLVNYLCEMKKQKGYKTCIAWTMKHGPSKGFYEKTGFKRMDNDEKMWKFDVPLIKYTKII